MLLFCALVSQVDCGVFSRVKVCFSPVGFPGPTGLYTEQARAVPVRGLHGRPGPLLPNLLVL